MHRNTTGADGEKWEKIDRTTLFVPKDSPRHGRIIQKSLSINIGSTELYHNI